MHIVRCDLHVVISKVALIHTKACFNDMLLHWSYIAN